ncbi:coiled-coil and C2 domain-containing protein 1-like isoform X2 [Cotesia glomerata]|nr:coiled-coil and C2 domain-containing protein 1-like isoform X2 [Cotesia glomerata]
MFGRKKEQKKERKPRTNNPLGIDFMGGFDPTGGFNLMGVPDDDEDDEDLESELNRLAMGDDPRPRRPAPKPPAELIDLNFEVKEIGSDEELSGDDNDPELLNELNALKNEDDSPNLEEVSSTPSSSAVSPGSEELVKLLEERLDLYKQAESKAKSTNDTSKARRYNRGVKTLQGMLRDAKAGKNVESADIPPLLPRSATQVTPDTPADQEPDTQEIPLENSTQPEVPPEIPPEVSPEAPPAEPIPVDEEKLALLKKRQHEYKIAAVAWKKSGQVEEAVKYLKIAVRFDVVISALTSGEPVDLSDMPPTPDLPNNNNNNNSPAVTATEINPPQEPAKEESEVQDSVEEPPAEAPAPVTGGDIIGALKERLEVYRRTKTAAEEEGNSSKVRRYGRICKQYEDAIKLHSKGKSIPVDELPVPPGFPPIVLNVAAPKPAPAPAPKPAPVPGPKTSPEKAAIGIEEKPTAPARGKPMTSRAQKQTIILQKRQIELKRAALAAKKEGDLDLAKDYLRQAKQIEPLIQASMGGLPVDLASVPLSPVSKEELHNSIAASSNDSFALVSSDDCQSSEATGTDQEIYDNLEKQLVKHRKVCLATRDHAKALGDVPGYNRWENMALGFSRDLDMLRVRRRDGLPPPQHHYEVKTYAIVQSCTDLTDSDVELSIIRGVNYPKEVDSYVIYEFPYPTENSPTDRTSTVRNTSAPEYDATFTLTGSIDRSSRQCQRTYKRHSLKCQVWSKGGFLRSDNLLGTVTVKLQPLETQCILHDTFPLMNGRKAAGGQLEIKIRVRNPITTKQIEKMTDRWLVIDN